MLVAFDQSLRVFRPFGVGFPKTLECPFVRASPCWSVVVAREEHVRVSFVHGMSFPQYVVTMDQKVGPAQPVWSTRVGNQALINGHTYVLLSNDYVGRYAPKCRWPA